MLRRARILLALFALATLSASPAVFADDTAGSGDTLTQILDWLAGVFGGGDSANDEFNPQHLPGG